jgi:hypothetical protein
MNKLSDFIEQGGISNDDMVQEIEALGNYLGLETIASYAKRKNTDYNNVKKSSLRKVTIFGVKFVIDND